jgi:hypothetical protein
MELLDKSFEFPFVLVCSLVLTCLILLGQWFMNWLITPSASKVKKGFVAPGKIEIGWADLDGDGKVETFAVIDGKRYLLKKGDPPGSTPYFDLFKL